MKACLNIDEDEFFAWYPEEVHYTWELLTTQPTTKHELITKYLPSKLWRLHNLYYITDKHGNKVKFSMNRSQHKLHAASFIHPRILVLKSRQQGISTFELIDSFDDVLFMRLRSNGLMAQGTDEATKLLERVTNLWDDLSPEIKDFLHRKIVKNNSKEFTLNNKSSIFVRTSFRSATLQRLHISEFGKIANKYPDRANETKTGTMQTIASGNRMTVESTAEGHNDFKDMWDNAMSLQKSNTELAPKDFYPLFLSWLEDPDCHIEVDQAIDDEARKYFEYLEREIGLTLSRTQKNFWIMQYRELGGDIYQEYPATPEEAFRASKNGTYWANAYMHNVVRLKKRRKSLFDPNLPVYATIDAGMHDYFVFVFFQIYGDEIRIIGEFFHNNEILAYYANYLKDDIPKEWELETIFVPHDFGVRELGADTAGKTRQDQWADLGITNTELMDRTSKANGIELVRTEMPNIYIDSDCDYLDECFMNYSKKWDKKLRKWSTDDENTQYRHGADAIRYMVDVAVNKLRNSRNSGRSSIANGIAL